MEKYNDEFDFVAKEISGNEPITIEKIIEDAQQSTNNYNITIIKRLLNLIVYNAREFLCDDFAFTSEKLKLHRPDGMDDKAFNSRMSELIAEIEKDIDNNEALNGF
ncbi:hypothetical protein FAM22279_01975 [Lacticaseibacillus paracasei]|uniref:Uncharacterized protein n=1 Tax=Lacticaseibacillus paracasei subsp. paracasei Lpp71 TaxID=1256207 RepID=A0A8E0ITH8_LACPA|nr:hypothetical protein [Lacticaseibacillus paracasei]EPC77123.1 hypothetical protein Lpp71_02336 [Lacticaseibacillus paracasei subsp. paracasei Lpp71]RNE07290.1 hypothetical protein FAM22279_01975 [Lacticaseibacillus paracasei]